MKRLLSIAALLPFAASATPAYYNSIQKIDNETGRVQCESTWSVFFDGPVYESFSLYCILRWGPIGPGTPTEVAWELTSGSSDTFSDYHIGIVDYDTVTPGCGDLKWKLDSVHAWIKRPQHCGSGTPCSGTVPKQTIKVITWVQ